MCLAIIALQAHPHFPLIIASNRDEYFTRPTLPAHFWPDNTNVYVGKDELHGGTWLGINKRG